MLNKCSEILINYEKNSKFFFRTETLLALIVIISHFYFLMVDGATFWIDATAYVSLGDAISSPGGLVVFYKDLGRWFYSHLQPGLPLLSISLGLFPEYFRWPILAVLQHTIGAFAIYYAFLTLNKYWPSKVHLVLCTLLCLLPFYQAFHNSLMTESISSSLLIIAFALWIRLIKESNKATSRHFWMVLCLLLVGQFRSYFSLIIFMLVFVALYVRKELFTKYLVIYCVSLILSLSIFPVYRYFNTGEFFFPKTGLNKLMSGLWMNLSPSQAIRQQIIQSGDFDGMDISNVLRHGLSYSEMIDVGFLWKQKKMDNAAIVAEGERLGALLSSDGSVFYKRILMGLASSGLVLPYCLTGLSAEVFPGMVASDMCRHLRQHYAFLGWIDASRHDQLIEPFFGKNEDSNSIQGWEASQKKVVSMLEGHTNLISVYFRDPLFLGRLPPDTWMLLFVVAMGVILLREPWIGCGLAVIFLSNFFIMFSHPLGNIRYSYFLFPLAFLGLSIAISVLQNRKLIALAITSK